MLEMKLTACITGVQHIGIPTAQYEATLNFFGKLGFSVELATVNPVSDCKVAFLTCEGVTLEIYQVPESSMSYGSVDHIALNVFDIEEAYIIAEECGFKILEDDIQFLPFWNNGVRFFTVEGPNKEKIEFNQKL